ncbi:MAG: molecular chaperone DnaJ [Ramlibacter sp.]|nr:molecular chaperone DnaJ [Ramlibacter sp.]
MNVDDSYHELGLAPDSTDAEVKAAWRRLAARWHPDRNNSPHALRKIQRINRALEEIRRAREEAPGAVEEEEESSPEPGVEHTVSITLEEVVTGCTRELQGKVVQDCAECAGSGLQPQATRCSECAGSGQVRQRLWFAWIAAAVTCSTCQGQGVTRKACASCAATGKTAARKYRCRVQIPAGARAGDLLDAKARVTGGQRAGEQALRVRVELQNHAFFAFEADGSVKCEVPVDGFAWMANRWIEVPTPRGLQQMRLRRGHLSYRIRGAGLPWQDDGAAADCFVTVAPVFPEVFSLQQEAAVDRLIATNSGAAGTAAGDRMAAWKRVLESWQDRLG